jgi:hypothetical protein
MSRLFADTVELPHRPGHTGGGCQACATALIDEFNRRYPTGGVSLRTLGSPVVGRTRAAAEMFAGRCAAVRIEGSPMAVYLGEAIVVGEFAP